MIDWKQYGPVYTVAPGIKKLGTLPIIEFDREENRYLVLKKKSYENIYYDKLYNNEIDSKIIKKIKEILFQEYPNKKFNYDKLKFEYWANLVNSKF